MLRCDKHRKDFIGACMWCGKKVCEYCIAKQEGAKAYCEKCTALLEGMQRATIPKVEPIKQPTLKKGQKLVFEDGYLVLYGG